MIDSKKYELYCKALGESLKEITKEAIDKRKNSIGLDNEIFNTGYLCAFHRIITLMQQQAEIFDITYDDLGIDFNEDELI